MPKIYRGLSVEYHRKVAWRIKELDKLLKQVEALLDGRYSATAPPVRKLALAYKALDALHDAMKDTARKEHGRADFCTFRRDTKKPRRGVVWSCVCTETRSYDDAYEGRIVKVFEYDATLTGTGGCMPCPACRAPKITFPRPKKKRGCPSCNAMIVLRREPRAKEARVYTVQAFTE